MFSWLVGSSGTILILGSIRLPSARCPCLDVASAAPKAHVRLLFLLVQEAAGEETVLGVCMIKLRHIDFVFETKCLTGKENVLGEESSKDKRVEASQ